MNRRNSAGPEFLYKAAEFWPGNKVQVPLEEDKRERKRLGSVGVSQESEPVLGWKRYSSQAKLRERDTVKLKCTVVCLFAWLLELAILN